MKKVALINEWWKFAPEKEDFKQLEAHLLINQMFAIHFVKNDGKIQMLHPFHLNDIALKYKVQPELRQLLVQFIENLPDEAWQEFLNIHQIS